MAQNQRPLYSNYIPGLNANPVQVPNSINKSSGNTPQYGLFPPIKTYPNLQGYNPVNMIPSQINQTHQILGSKSNFITSPQIQNAIQPQVVIKTTPNMIYNPNINTNLINTNQNQIPIRNNINIPYNINIISNQNMIQGKSNQVHPLYESNINNQNIKQNITISENNSIQNKIKNELLNKNSIVQNERTKEILNGHPAVPMELANKALESICKITYNYDNTYVVYYDYTILANIRQERNYNGEGNGITTITLVQMTDSEKKLAQLRADVDFIAIMQEVPL
jgi:hypothetical protein